MFRMKSRAIASALVLCLIMLVTPICWAQSQANVVQYSIVVNGDGSASWTITQVTSINSTTDTWNGFMQRALSLVAAATVQTGREMAVDNSSFEMSTTNFQDSQSKTTEYLFTWVNFSIMQGAILMFGDVFRVNNFFGQLYGDGTLQVSYPPTYVVQSVSPSPNQRNDSQHVLEWLGTQFFVNGNPSITLTLSSSTTVQTGGSTDWQLYVLIGVSVTAAISALLAAFYLGRRRRSKTSHLAEVMTEANASVLESEEQKVQKIIRSHGGSMFQSAITEECRFSKAKTSQLLSALEQKGMVRRYKKGRDKIVTLVEPRKGEKS
jgi:LPXTG-motif cell wall-anchored protein